MKIEDESMLELMRSRHQLQKTSAEVSPSFICAIHRTGLRLRSGYKFNIFSREDHISSGVGGRILIFSPENVKYQKLLSVELLFSCKLSKTAQPHDDTFQRGSTTAPEGRNPQP